MSQIAWRKYDFKIKEPCIWIFVSSLCNYRLKFAFHWDCRKNGMTLSRGDTARFQFPRPGSFIYVLSRPLKYYSNTCQTHGIWETRITFEEL